MYCVTFLPTSLLDKTVVVEISWVLRTTHLDLEQALASIEHN
jgi:hypothetical protein